MRAPEEFQVNGKTYRARLDAMDTFKQADIARRLMPLIPELGPLLKLVISLDLDSGSLPPGVDPLAAFGSIATCLAKMPDEDARFIERSCLSIVDRKMDNDTGWGPILAGGSTSLMFDDIELPEFLQIVIQVIRRRFGRFFPAPRS